MYRNNQNKDVPTSDVILGAHILKDRYITGDTGENNVLCDSKCMLSAME